MEYLFRKYAPLPAARKIHHHILCQDNRRFVEAVPWLLRQGCRRRAWPAEWGNWHAAYTRFQGWTASGVWARVLAAVQADAALYALLVDSATVRADQQASGGGRKKTGQSHDGPRALPLLEGLAPAHLIADRGTTPTRRLRLGPAGLWPGPLRPAPPRRAALQPPQAVFKQFRRVATRYEKLDARLLALIHLASTVPWLRDS